MSRHGRLLTLALRPYRRADPRRMPWTVPVVNSVEYDFHPTLSFDGTTLIFASERGGEEVGWGDPWMTTRTKLRGRR